MRIIFFGSDEWFSGPVLEAILQAGIDVPVVVTKGEDGKKFISSLVHKFGREKEVRILEAKTEGDILKERLVTAFDGIATPDSRRDRNDRLTVNGSRFANDNRPDAVVLASFGPPFLPKEVLNWPKYGCLNVHASLLPRWRGASPVFAALAAGDKKTGVSIMRMTEEIDQGPVLGQKKIMIARPGLPKGAKGSDLGSGERSDPFDTRETLTKKLGKLGGKLIVETLKKLETGQISEVRQPEKSPTPYTRRLTKESGRIDWRFRPGETGPERSRRIERFIRAATPWPGAWTKYKDEGRRTKDEGKVIKILKAHLEKLPQRDCHSRFNRDRNDVTLVIDLLQLPGKNPISWKQFLAGHPNVTLL